MGKLIVIEGLDGCGKTTQLELLKERNKEFNYITFPYYETNSGKIVSDYLHGVFDEKNAEISCYSASAFYAVDRYTSFKTHWEKLYNMPNILISARYVSSNAIYQMTKIDRSEWNRYLNWLEDFEYNKFGIPRPSLIIFLDMDIDASQKLMSGRYNGDEAKKDVHERDVNFLRACREAALYVAEKQGWHIIPCCEDGRIRTIESIYNDIFAKIKEVANA